MSCVLHCINSLAVGGVESGVLAALEHFAESSSPHRHVLCAFRGGMLERTRVPQLQAAGIECIVLRRPGRFSLRFCRALMRSVNDVNPDVVHTYNPGPAMWVRLLTAGRSETRVIADCRGVGVFRSLTGRAIERSLQSRTAAYVFNSESTRKVWEHYLNIRCPRQVVYTGVAPRPSHAADRTENDNDNTSTFRLLTVCRITDIKSLDTQVHAVEVLRRRGMADIELTIVGDGPARARLQDLVRQLALQKQVRLTGYHENPRALHARAHIYLCTSYNETFGISPAEAMCDGVVCIAGSVGGPAEMIEDGENGFLVPCTVSPPEQLRRKLPPVVYDPSADCLRAPLGVDPSALADKIVEVRQRYADLGCLRDAARKSIARRFGLDRHCRILEELYDRLASNRDAFHAEAGGEA